MTKGLRRRGTRWSTVAMMALASAVAIAPVVAAPPVSKELDPVVMVTLLDARTLPRKFDPVPIVAELPICQKMLQLWPPLIIRTCDAEAVVSALPNWKMKTALGSPCASSVKVPVNPIDDAEQ